MFLKRHRRHRGGETYEYWTLVKTVRTARGPRHQTVAHLGKLDGQEFGRYPAAAAVFEVTVEPEHGLACRLRIEERTEKLNLAQLAQGAYVLRTNHPETDPRQLWRWYIQLTQAEAAFRTAKSDLALRPIFHQKTERVDAHILVCFLALALWRSLEQWTQAKGIGDCARQLLLELDQLSSLDVVLPTATAGDLRLRMVARPEKPLANLLAHLGLELPRTPKIVENVVPKNAPSKIQPFDDQRELFSE
jgi:hypothetical protein